jgi:hypothetical protein
MSDYEFIDHSYDVVVLVPAARDCARLLALLMPVSTRRA